MRLLPVLLLVAVLVNTGCNRASSSGSSGASEFTVIGPAPRVVTPATGTERNSKALSGKFDSVFKPVAQRSTDDLIAEVERFDTKDRLPLLAELAKRPKDKTKVIPAARKLLLDGRYAVRVLAAMVCVAVDQERPAEYATEVNVTIAGKNQLPVYGPIVEDTLELRQVRELSVRNLVKVLDKELAAGKGPYEQTFGVLTILGTIPAPIGAPAVASVKRVAATPMHPNAVHAVDLLKKWGVNAE